MAMNTRTTTIPVITYRDAHAAIKWLCSTFGFTQKSLYEGPNGTVMHAELTFGSGMIMLSTHDPQSEWGKLSALPNDIGGRETQSTALISADPDELYRRVQAAGVPILRTIRDESYGGRSFVCRDLEGHIWSVGSYDPWASS
jgi:uncharacterized glyoxalase superfamily protein PhnB